MVSLSDVWSFTRSTQVEARWSNLLSSSCSLGRIVTMVASRTTPSRHTPTIFPNCFVGTRPMNIMTKTVAKSRAAVERFSVTMRAQVRQVAKRMIFMALLSAPFSVCPKERMSATKRTRAPLAISEGWNLIPKLSHRAPSFSFAPMMSVRMRRKMLMG